MWSSKDTPTNMEEILNDTISAQELEVNFITFIILKKQILSHRLFIYLRRLSTHVIVIN